jgi:trimeric autotransporter adhesin
MDPMQNRLEALEQQTDTVQRQLRWWRGVACGLIVLALLTWALPAGTAPQKSVEQRVAALEELLVHFSRVDNEVFITEANLHIVNGEGATQTINGLGNLIVGYNELRTPDDPFGFNLNNRTGSHNVILGMKQNFSGSGGLVVGLLNAIIEDSGSAIGGIGNFAIDGTVIGGVENVARGRSSVVDGGRENVAGGGVVVGGELNRTRAGVIVGGRSNNTDHSWGSVCGGLQNRASGSASVSGGELNTASGFAAAVSGGRGNTASGDFASVSGGLNRTAEGDFDWVAGTLFEEE